MSRSETFDLMAELNAEIRRSYRSNTRMLSLNLSPLAGHLLTLIARYPDLSQQRLGDATGREKSQVARAMKELETRGLIRRHAASGDGRAKAAALTEAGHAALGTLNVARSEMADRAFADLDDAEQVALQDMLRRVLDAVRVG